MDSENGIADEADALERGYDLAPMGALEFCLINALQTLERQGDQVLQVM
jgi:hypothetical protein